MKRAGRWLFNFVAAVSLVVSVSAAVAWPVSYIRAAWILRTAPDGERIWVSLSEGGLEFGHLDANTKYAAYAPGRLSYDRAINRPNPYGPIPSVRIRTRGFGVLGFWWLTEGP